MQQALARPIYWFLHLWVLAYCAVLIAALALQFALGELPCPLCMLQRYGMMLSTIGPVWIILQANRGQLTPQRYQQGLGLAALGALIGAAVAARQVLLHILPGDPGYGAPVLELHLYSWALVTFLVVLLAAAALGILAPATLRPEPAPPPPHPLSRVTIALFVAVVAVNAVMIVFLEGFAWVLPDDPASYRLLDQLG
ncbi:MAG: disulfide bond formation protein B [Aestuariivirga sp.]|uniref:disulfide bond formation protein B n=1 Tax=Aestuariivirga sp. TaxID=2650926 RepID=UPI0038D1A452